jgi:hypothetical protein
MAMRATLVSPFLAPALLVGAVAPALGASATFPDPVDTPGGADVTSMKVTHENRVKVVLRHTGLEDHAAVDLTYWLDTKPRNAGPEYVVWFAANAGGFDVRRVDGWRDRGRAVDCDRYRARADVFTDDPIMMWVHRSCLGNPKKVRVGVKVREIEEGTTTVDWVPGKRELSDWVRYG